MMVAVVVGVVAVVMLGGELGERAACGVVVAVLLLLLLLLLHMNLPSSTCLPPFRRFAPSPFLPHFLPTPLPPTITLTPPFRTRTGGGGGGTGGGNYYETGTRNFLTSHLCVIHLGRLLVTQPVFPLTERAQSS
ncbi:hypothetical protein E2C01_078666 [Portunus trituberculatus]|uniref:Uncharacterized protein n=1 Tax=Portunus trituberculatus TaxID=210409 RepID=A0A5B7INF9_PORTR|nr:hypothetical protein [Portunus trituberculatus]